MAAVAEDPPCAVVAQASFWRLAAGLLVECGGIGVRVHCVPRDLITEQALILLHTDEIEEPPNKRNALASLTDDAIVEILRRLPARSLFYYKCVCHSLNRLIKDYNNHKVLPQTLADFYDFDQGHQRYTSVTEEHLSLSFLPFTLDNVAISDIYKGLILCWCRGADGLYRYVVYNLATKKFKELPPSIHSIGEA
ncbi:F-box protein At5g49610-like [Miscanthus floridulus]|uniref:F-box protein At5g49610-like n=1 Tax=Miscanthus floridulus TaxID=154761 RepID=UPI0034573FE2